jgi:hypothetical protein
LRDVDELLSREVEQIYKIYTPTATRDSVGFSTSEPPNVLSNFWALVKMIIANVISEQI